MASNLIYQLFSTSGAFNRFVNRFGDMRRINFIAQRISRNRLRNPKTVCAKARGYGSAGVYVRTLSINDQKVEIILGLEAATMIDDDCKIEFEEDLFRGDREKYKQAEFLTCLGETLFNPSAIIEDEGTIDRGATEIRHPEFDFVIDFNGKVTQHQICDMTGILGSIERISAKRVGRNVDIDFTLRPHVSHSLWIRNATLSGGHLEKITID